MHVYGLALVGLNLAWLALGDELAQAALGRNGRASPEELIRQWPSERLWQYLRLRGLWENTFPEQVTHLLLTPHGSCTHDRETCEPRKAIETAAVSALFTPIDLSIAPPGRQGSLWCEALTVDQLVYWAARYSGRRVNSHGANVFDAPPTLVRSREKRQAAVELCRQAWVERVLHADPDGVDASPTSPAGQRGEWDRDAERVLARELAEAEAAPHVFEPEVNPVLARRAKHSIYDLRHLLDVFGVEWSEHDSHARLLELAKVHTALWIGQKPE